jgi:hypothetical protein
MPRNSDKTTSIIACLPVGALAAVLVFGVTTASQAKKTGPVETNLATPSQALTYCQTGGMPAGDVDYFGGAGGLAQYGSAKSCAQQVPAKGKVKKAIVVNGNTVAECKLSTAKQALAFCNSGAMGTWDIDYIGGKVGQTISGPGYGCEVNSSTSSIGQALCN